MPSRRERSRSRPGPRRLRPGATSPGSGRSSLTHIGVRLIVPARAPEPASATPAAVSGADGVLHAGLGGRRDGLNADPRAYSRPW